MTTALHNKPRIKVAYVLSYRSPNYIRSLNLLDALSGIDAVELFQARNSKKSILRYPQTLLKLLWLRLRHNPDVYFLGFRGHEIFWLVRLICFRKILIFDSLMSPYSALKHERKSGRLGFLLSGLVFYFERAILKHSNLLLTDTDLHVDFLSQTFAIERQKIVALPMAAKENIETASKSSLALPPAWEAQPNALHVLFYGSFLPLHGLDIILRAITQLNQEQFAFHFIGGEGERLRDFLQAVSESGLHNISHEAWVSFDELLNHYIPNANICFGGPFGNTPQSQRVITGKTVQCLAQAKVTVVGQIATQYPFADRVNCLWVQQGDAEALRSALQWAAQNRDQLTAIGEQGQRLYQQCFSVERLREILKKILASI